MAGGTVLKWLKVGWESFLDPEKKQRVEELSDHLRRQIAKQKRAFDLEAAVRGLEFDPDDLRLSREMAYRTYVERALDDAQLTENERSSLEWVAQALRLTEKERSAIDRETGRRAFGEALAVAVQDGQIDETEASQFQSLAGWMRVPVSDVVSEFFAEEGEGFLRGMFFAAIEDGELVGDEWSRFLASAE
jgi:hypothetical protein